MSCLYNAFDMNDNLTLCNNGTIIKYSRGFFLLISQLQNIEIKFSIGRMRCISAEYMSGFDFGGNVIPRTGEEKRKQFKVTTSFLA